MSLSSSAAHADVSPSTATARYAQTNLQLYGQLMRTGYTDEHLTMIRGAYELAMQLFTASFRGSGKPLLAHLVGTASILDSIDQPPPVVCAGLLHAAYALGDFGDGRFGVTTAKRARLRAVVGSSVEDLIARYTAFEWNASTIPVIEQRLSTLAAGDRNVLVIRLANELEDHLDQGVSYCSNGEQRREYLRTPLNKSVGMARQLDLPQLADALDRAFTETLRADLPASLLKCRSYTFVQPPASMRPRARVTLRRFLDRRPALGRLLRPLVRRTRPTH